MEEKTTEWELLVQWADDTESWANISDLKYSFPNELAQYAVSNEVSE